MGSQGEGWADYRAALLDMVAVLPRREQPAAIRRVVETLRRLHEQAEVEAPEWLERLRAEAERRGGA